jgi:hypothetical protein
LIRRFEDMRVPRRIRPSQVGCGATIGRRRLYAASASTNPESTDKSQIAHLAFVIRADGQLVSSVDAFGFHSDLEQQNYASTAELVESSARGR